MEFFTNEYRLEDEVDKLVKWIKDYVMRRASIDNSDDGRVAVEIDVWEMFERFEYATMDNVNDFINQFLELYVMIVSKYVVKQKKFYKYQMTFTSHLM